MNKINRIFWLDCNIDIKYYQTAEPWLDSMLKEFNSKLESRFKAENICKLITYEKDCNVLSELNLFLYYLNKMYNIYHTIDFKVDKYDIEHIEVKLYWSKDDMIFDNN